MEYGSKIEWAVMSSYANLVASGDIRDRTWLDDHFHGFKIRKLFRDPEPVDDKDLLPDELMPKKHFGKDKKRLY
jgi:hypothetical protein